MILEKHFRVVHIRVASALDYFQGLNGKNIRKRYSISWRKYSYTREMLTALSKIQQKNRSRTLRRYRYENIALPSATIVYATFTRDVP